jgi:nucleoside-diphosphate-sugar epimerase
MKSCRLHLEAFEPMVLAAKQAGVQRFIYASSSSVYGVSDQPDVTEEHPLVPLTLYNKYKGMCEPLLLRHTTPNFVGVVFRPATVCGYAPCQWLDLSVNILTNHTIHNNKIGVT